ncbi:MAG: hypothetical protein LBT20_05985 [Clostridiales bacterium]|jgi:hypothetical protein|nr:hypothetical protein [Clostridiales bacterium]
MRLWIKIIKGERVAHGIVREVRGDYDGLTADMRTVCEELDIPTPMILRSRFKQLEEFNILKLMPNDFIESVNFDWLCLENCVES